MGIKVVQWGSGNVGAASMRTIIERPDMELVGLHVANPEKLGRDAGELAGLAPNGIIADNDLEKVLAADADVVLHMPLPSLVYGDDPGADLRNFEAMLRAGKHVVTTVGYMYPAVHGEDVAGRLEDACQAGGVTFHGTGANPGWFGDLLPLLMSGLSLRIDRMRVEEISNFQHYPSPQIMFDMMNFGRSPDDFERRAGRHRSWLDGLFTEAVQMVADGLDVRTEGIASESEIVLADTDLRTAAGTVEAGTVAGQRYRWVASVDGRPVVEQETVWRMHADVAPGWPVGDWSITIHGEPQMHVSLGHGWNRDVLGSTAAHAINSVPYLLECEPGVTTFLDLPIIAGRGAVFGH